MKADEKSSEITAVPRLLELTVIKGCIVTVDATGCQKDIASKFIDRQAGYLLALKGNRGALQEAVEDSFRFLPSVAPDERIDAGHGRVETRCCPVISDLSSVKNTEEWRGLRCPVRTEPERYFKNSGKTEKETRFNIGSLTADAQLISLSVRKHCGVEDSLHRVPDVDFREDYSRKGAGNAAQNFTLLNRIAVNLLKNGRTAKAGVRGKRLKTGWDNN